MRLFPQNRSSGGAMIVVLLTCLTVGTVLASYLALIGSRHKVAVRSQCWNAALPVLEAGIEEALAHIHADAGVLSANGWTPGTIGGQPVYAKTRSLTDGSHYWVTLYPASTSNLLIYSTGYVPSPLQSGTYICRTARVTATNVLSTFTKALVAIGTITLGGNAVVDAFDSHAGPYDLATNRLACGDIATDSSSLSAVDVNGGNVYGHVNTGPGGTVVAGNGSVGDLAWNATQDGIQPGWTNDNMNVAFSPNAPPSGGPFLPPPVVSVGGSNITYLKTDTYELTKYANSQSKQPMIVTGKATLLVTGDFTISGNGYVYIAPNASLTLYVGGSASIGGNGIVNATGLATGFSYIGLPGNRSITLAGNSDFIGTINAPQADVSITGGGSVYGAMISNTFKSTGNGGFHYDVALASAPGTPGTGFIATSWTEL